jgi:Uma2 family endonuclease
MTTFPEGPMAETTVKLTPADHGRRMSLADFDTAQAREGRRYELGRGVVVVTDIPSYRHLAQVDEVRTQLHTIHDQLDATLGAGECKILLEDFQSERHPDLAVYGTAPFDNGNELWWLWIPDLVIEVVSPGSEHRDYVEKREEYLAFGVREYWVVDADRGEMLALRRRGGRWAERVVRPPEVHRTTTLPGLDFDLAAVFAAAAGA